MTYNVRFELFGFFSRFFLCVCVCASLSFSQSTNDFSQRPAVEIKLQLKQKHPHTRHLLCFKRLHLDGNQSHKFLERIVAESRRAAATDSSQCKTYQPALLNSSSSPIISLHHAARILLGQVLPGNQLTLRTSQPPDFLILAA